MDSALDQRLANLESRIAHHELMAEEMSEMIVRQGKVIDRLTAQIRRLRDQLEAAEYSAGAPADDRPPPHY